MKKQKNYNFEINQFVEISLGQETFIHTSAVNLSEGGILCLTDRPCEPYSRVFLMLTLSLNDGDHTIRFEGVVVRSFKKGEKWETGVSISSIDDASKKILNKYFNQKKQK